MCFILWIIVKVENAAPATMEEALIIFPRKENQCGSIIIVGYFLRASN